MIGASFALIGGIVNIKRLAFAREKEKSKTSKFRKKPVVIEAVQFDGTDSSVDWLLPQLLAGEIGRTHNKLFIKTLEGVMEAAIGDYIIEGVNGEFYPCKPDVFEKTYEPA